MDIDETLKRLRALTEPMDRAMEPAAAREEIERRRRELALLRQMSSNLFWEQARRWRRASRVPADMLGPKPPSNLTPEQERERLALAIKFKRASRVPPRP